MIYNSYYGQVFDIINVYNYNGFRLAKERRKADKVVLDSQERAFWRVHRPPVSVYIVCVYIYIYIYFRTLKWWSFLLLFQFWAFIKIRLVISKYWIFVHDTKGEKIQLGQHEHLSVVDKPDNSRHSAIFSNKGLADFVKRDSSQQLPPIVTWMR